MKTLVVFYSKTGNTRKVGEAIAKNLNSDIDVIDDLKDRSRFIKGWIIAGKDAYKKNSTEIKIQRNPQDYDLVIVGTPVWAWTVTPAVRTYLSQNKFKKVAFFCTCGGQPGKTFEEMKCLSADPINTLTIIDKEVGSSETLEKINKFCLEINKK